MTTNQRQGPMTPAATPERSGSRAGVAVAALVGGGVALGSILLPWLGSGAFTLRPFDIPAAYLWSAAAAPSDISIGLVMLVGAGLTVAAALLGVLGIAPAGAMPAAAVFGSIATAIVAVFAAQTIRLGLDAGTPFADVLTDVIGYGVWVALVGALIASWSARLASRS
ncbi:MAG: hypothetical protein R3290_11430 [Acidimicrobiia bacterium]|nr:hypothetical protein [Acidimicrobiia bacterium]